MSRLLPVKLDSYKPLREVVYETLREAIRTYREHGCLTTWPDGRTAFGFVHGNWALDNSRILGGEDFCGVNDEITLLQEEGCYADFTFPAWQTISQPHRTNDIYYAIDDPAKQAGTPFRADLAPLDNDDEYATYNRMFRLGGGPPDEWRTNGRSSDRFQ